DHETYPMYMLNVTKTHANEKKYKIFVPATENLPAIIVPMNFIYDATNNGGFMKFIPDPYYDNTYRSVHR
ncbi:hypothetical protein HMI55_001369, partial [Coelomomyces lativittatus]